MALINVAKREALLPDGRTALVHRVVKIFGVPIFEDSFVSKAYFLSFVPKAITIYSWL